MSKRIEGILAPKPEARPRISGRSVSSPNTALDFRPTNRIPRTR